eukprot:4416331-Amphidinium_carterae.1
MAPGCRPPRGLQEQEQGLTQGRQAQTQVAHVRIYPHRILSDQAFVGFGKLCLYSSSFDVSIIPVVVCIEIASLGALSAEFSYFGSLYNDWGRLAHMSVSNSGKIFVFHSFLLACFWCSSVHIRPIEIETT